MPTVLRAKGFRFVIYVDDHPPAHVHVQGRGEMKINLQTADGLPQMVSAIGCSKADRRKAMDIVRDNQLPLLRQWKAIHGR